MSAYILLIIEVFKVRRFSEAELLKFLLCHEEQTYHTLTAPSPNHNSKSVSSSPSWKQRYKSPRLSSFHEHIDFLGSQDVFKSSPRINVMYRPFRLCIHSFTAANYGFKTFRGALVPRNAVQITECNIRCIPDLHRLRLFNTVSSMSQNTLSSERL